MAVVSRAPKSREQRFAQSTLARRPEGVTTQGCSWLVHRTRGALPSEGPVGHSFVTVSVVSSCTEQEISNKVEGDQPTRRSYVGSKGSQLPRDGAPVVFETGRQPVEPRYSL